MLRMRDRSSGELAQVVPEASFHITRRVEAARVQSLYPILGRGASQRSNTRIPPRSDLDIRWQTGVHQALRVRDRPFVELCDAGRERLDESVEFGVRQRAIHIAVGFGLFSTDIVGTQEHLKGPVSSNELRQSRHWAAAGNHPYAYLPLREDGFFAADETHVARERDLAAVSRRATADQRNGGNW